MSLLNLGLGDLLYAARALKLSEYPGISSDYETFVKRMKQRSDIFWMFFPINTGEFIRQAWIRQIESQPEPVIVVR
jgi:hypothetical protein